MRKQALKTFFLTLAISACQGGADLGQGDKSEAKEASGLQPGSEPEGGATDGSSEFVRGQEAVPITGSMLHDITRYVDCQTDAESKLDCKVTSDAKRAAEFALVYPSFLNNDTQVVLSFSDPDTHAPATMRVTDFAPSSPITMTVVFGYESSVQPSKSPRVSTDIAPTISERQACNNPAHQTLLSPVNACQQATQALFSFACHLYDNNPAGLFSWTYPPDRNVVQNPPGTNPDLLLSNIATAMSNPLRTDKAAFAHITSCLAMAVPDECGCQLSLTDSGGNPRGGSFVMMKQNAGEWYIRSVYEVINY